MYKNPLHIIPSDKVENLTSPQLKRIKKELLLRFELSQETTVKINGRDYDKNTVIETFDNLKGDISHHIKVLQHPTLMAFLEEGKLDFFKSRRGLLILHDPEFKAWLRPYFIDRLSKVYYQSVTNKGFASIHVLLDLKESTFQLPSDWEDAVFARTFKFLNNYITEAENRFLSPTLPNNSKRLKPGIEDYVDVFYMNIYKHLPKERFANLKYRYGIWCNQIVYKVFKEKTEVSRVDRASLKVLNAAATIAAEVFNPEGNKQIARTISSYLYSGGSGSRGESSSSWGAIYFVVILFIFLIRMANCSNNQRSNNYNYNNNYNKYSYNFQERQSPQLDNQMNTILREAKLKAKSYGVQDMKIMSLRKSDSPVPSVGDVLTVNYDFDKKYNIEGKIHREEPSQKITDFSAFIRPAKDEFKYRIAGYGNSIDTLQLSTIEPSDFILGPSIDSRGTTRLQQVKAALSNFFILKDLKLEYGKSIQRPQLTVGTMTNYKTEKGTVEWVESPYDKLHLIKINSRNFTALYYVDVNTQVIYKMQFLGRNTIMDVVCVER